ncbi:MAG TPA: hypothetical protein VJM46_03795 [Candidatus Saccharimonadales bacterium]|nr:hypothetical protein [Candidatus Saccharimonadales bacterium]
MPRDAITHDGTSWEALRLSYQSGGKLYALIEPKQGVTGQRRLLINVTRLSNFRSGSFFFVDGITPRGEKVELHGYGRHTPDDPCTFEVHKITAP